MGLKSLLKDLQKDLSKEEIKQVHTLIASGVVNRARILSFIFSFGYAAYATTSLDFIRLYKPHVTLWDNFWPRLIFNILPLIFLSLLFKDFRSRPILKSWIWTFSLPATFVAACCVYVWPIMYEGHGEIYLYVHSANTILITFSSLLVSQPPRQVLAMQATFLCFFHSPILWMLYKAQNILILKLYANEMLLFSLISIIGAHTIYQLRLKLAILDVKNKKMVKKFVGNTVTSAIFEQKQELLEERKADGFLLSMDVRGSTELIKKYGEQVASQFMKEYQEHLTRIMGAHNGYIHKFNGDGHIISFGVMDEKVDLTEIPGLEEEEKIAAQNRNTALLKESLQALEEVITQFYELKAKHGIQSNTRIGAAVDFGPVGIGMRGNDSVRLELDITGSLIVRVTRLEAYTKTLSENEHNPHSLIVLSSTAATFLSKQASLFKTYSTTEHPVRDFPEIQEIFFQELGPSEDTTKQPLKSYLNSDNYKKSIR